MQAAATSGRVVNPPAGSSRPSDENTPAEPVDSPVEWLLTAVARRELTVSNGPITVTPSVELDDGVVTGSFDTTGTQNPLNYTVISGPSAGGKLQLNPDGSFSFLPYGTVVEDRGTETFSVMVSELPPLVAALTQVPLVGSLVEPIVVALHQVPIFGDLLQPIIGYAVTVPVAVDIDELGPVGTPIAFTVKVLSFDGTPISTNFFPASGLLVGETAPTILNGPGLAIPGDTDPDTLWAIRNVVPGLVPLRTNGYNVVTWDPRGEFASGGTMGLDSPFFEARDVSAIIDLLAELPGVQLDDPGDPRMGMVGGSYGGGIQLVTAATDHRVDAIVPSLAWNSLEEAFYPNDAFRSSWAALLFLGVQATGGRLPEPIYTGLFTGALFGVLLPRDRAVLASSGPTILVNNITAPTLLIHGTVDTLFTLQQATANAEMLDANGVPVKMVWFCGGHGVCQTSTNDGVLVANRTLDWLDRYVKGEPVDTGPKFEFVDQNGQFYSSERLPSDPEFYGDPVVVSGGGGILPTVPVIGDSGPLVLAWRAGNAVNLTTPAAVATTVIAGAPELTITYSGVGTSRHVYAQLVDDTTGRVLGIAVTPIPVTLDGQTHTVTVPLEQVAHTLEPGQTLTLQIAASAAQFANFTSVGVINVSDMQLTLPTASAAEIMAEP